MRGTGHRLSLWWLTVGLAVLLPVAGLAYAPVCRPVGSLGGLQSGTWDQQSGGIGGLLAITEVTGGSTNIFLPLSDQVGTIHALVAAMTNSLPLSQPCVLETRTYSPYGELLEVATHPTSDIRHPTSPSPCPFGFQSKYYDPETGFWYYGYRYYDARSGKWLTSDPLQEAGGLNLTAFCGGDPVNRVDPLGLSVWSEREDRMDALYREGRPVSAFLYMFGVSAWNGFSFGMLNRQSGIEDALGEGDITLGRYAAGQQVNASVAMVQLALTAGGAGQVAAAARGSTTLAGVLGQGARIGGRIGFLGSAAETLGSRLVDGVAGVAHGTTWGQDARTVAGGTLGGAALGAGSAGLAYGADYAYASLLRTLDDFAAIRYAPRVTLQSGVAAKSLPNPYSGIQQASRYLQDMGVSRADRVRYLQSFEPQNMVVRQAGEADFGLRYFSDPSRAGGQFLFETFPASRASLAIKPDWSAMTGFRQFQIRPGATMLEGRAAAQGLYLPGGQNQVFILDWMQDLIGL